MRNGFYMLLLLGLGLFTYTKYLGEEAAAGQQQYEQQVRLKGVSFEVVTDPEGAVVRLWSEGKYLGQKAAPFTVSALPGEEIRYEVPSDTQLGVRETQGTFTAAGDGETVSIWIDRMTNLERNATILDDMRSQVLTRCESMVRDRLRSPASAKFPPIVDRLLSYEAVPTEGYATYRAYVDSQNGFGAMLRTQYGCRYAVADHAITLEYLR